MLGTDFVQVLVGIAAFVTIVLGIGALGGNRIVRWYRSHAEDDRQAELRTITTQVVTKALEPVQAESRRLAGEIANHTEADRVGFSQAAASDLLVKDEILERFSAFAQEAATERGEIHARLDDLQTEVAAVRVVLDQKNAEHEAIWRAIVGLGGSRP